MRMLRDDAWRLDDTKRIQMEVIVPLCVVPILLFTCLDSRIKIRTLRILLSETYIFVEISHPIFDLHSERNPDHWKKRTTMNFKEGGDLECSMLFVAA